MSGKEDPITTVDQYKKMPQKDLPLHINELRLPNVDRIYKEILAGPNTQQRSI